MGLMEDRLYVLLTNTDEENAGYVLKRFQEIGCEGTVAREEVAGC